MNYGQRDEGARKEPAHHDDPERVLQDHGSAGLGAAPALLASARHHLRGVEFDALPRRAAVDILSSIAAPTFFLRSFEKKRSTEMKKVMGWIITGTLYYDISGEKWICWPEWYDMLYLAVLALIMFIYTYCLLLPEEDSSNMKGTRVHGRMYLPKVK